MFIKLLFFLGLGCLCFMVIGDIKKGRDAELTRALIHRSDTAEMEEAHAPWLLRFGYTSYVGRGMRQVLRMPFASKAYGYFVDSRWSRYKIKPFIKKHAINMDDYIVPEGGYKSFNDFFIRKLKPGARAIDQDKQVFVSPADSNLFVVPEISQDTEIFVKGKSFDVQKFLQGANPKEPFPWERYKGGTLLIFRLRPKDYHRYHFPVRGVPGPSIRIPGALETVQPLAYKLGFMPLQENERQRVVLQTDVGPIVMMVVGAMFVGRIIQTYAPSKEYAKGDEMGYFAFGGSTVAVLLEKGVLDVDRIFVDNAKKGIETFVRMGQRIGRFRS